MVLGTDKVAVRVFMVGYVFHFRPLILNLILPKKQLLRLIPSTEKQLLQRF